MKSLKLGILLGTLAFAPLAIADSESEREAEKLLTSMDMQVAMSESISNMIDLQLQQNPTLEPFKPVMMKFFNKHMSWESLKPEFVKMYARVYTAEELRDIHAFYSTDTGRKALKLMPVLMAEGGKIGAARVENNISELHAMMEAEAKRLKNAQ